MRKNVTIFVMHAEILCAAFMAHMESLFGPRVFKIIIEDIEQEYLGGEMHAVACLVERPELFENALAAILGNATRDVMRIICEDIRKELKLPNSVIYSNIGDLKKYIVAAKAP